MLDYGILSCVKAFETFQYDITVTNDAFKTL